MIYPVAKASVNIHPAYMIHALPISWLDSLEFVGDVQEID